MLLERDDELTALAAALAAARAGAGRLVLVEGPAGIGKTQLLRAGRAVADRDGVRVLGARASELERDFAFAVVRQLFEPALVAAAPEERAQLLGGAARPAAALVAAEPGDAA